MRWSHTALGFYLFALSGCGMLMRPPPTAPATSGPEVGKSTPEARAALKKTTETNLTQCEDKTADTVKKLDEAIAKLSGGQKDPMGNPMPPLAKIVADLNKEKVKVTIENVGSPQSPVLMVKDSFMEEGKTMVGAPTAKLQAFAKRAQKVNPLLSALRDQVNSVQGALGSSLTSTQSCVGFAQGLTYTFAGMSNGGEEPTSDLFGVYAKFLEANQKSQGAAASSLALVGVAQAGLAGKDAKAIDTLLDGVKKAKDAPPTVSETQARDTYRTAARELVEGCEANLEKYYKAHPEVQKPAQSPCSGEGLKSKAPPPPSAEVDPTMVPSDSPLLAAADSVGALARGDFLGAIKSAAKLVPGGSPVGNALSSVLGFL